MLARLLVAALLATFTYVSMAFARDQTSKTSSETSLLEARELFRRSVSDLGGDIFILPARGNYLLSDSLFRPEILQSSHIRVGTTVRKLPPHALNMHGVAWDYDVHIPMTFFDPKQRWFRQAKLTASAVQQDIVPTLAALLRTTAPSQSAGRVLNEAFTKKALEGSRPKVILILVQDQTGHQYLRAHPTRHPFLASIMAKGATFTRAQVAHVDVETAVGHAAIGTGAYPRGHGVAGNNFFNRGTGDSTAIFTAKLSETGRSDAYPGFFLAPTLSDQWLHARQGRPVVFSMAAAARAAVAMGGHGVAHRHRVKNPVVFLEERGPRAGQYVADEHFYSRPASFEGKNLSSHVEQFLNARGKDWYGHKLHDDQGKLEVGMARATPAASQFEAELVLAAIDELKIGADDETDLLWLNMKSTDYCGHLFGFESEECGEVLESVDGALKRIVDRLSEITSQNFAVVFTADHGAAPLPELSGAVRFSRDQLKADIEARFDKLDNGTDLIQTVTSSQIYVNRAEMAANGVTIKDIVTFLKSYRVPLKAPYNALADEWIKKGHPRESLFFHDVVAREDL